MPKSKHRKKDKSKRGNEEKKATTTSLPSLVDHDNNKTTTHHHHLQLHLPAPFPSHLSKPSRGFLKDEPPYMASFQAAMEGPYEGFVVDSPKELQAEVMYQRSNRKQEERHGKHSVASGGNDYQTSEETKRITTSQKQPKSNYISEANVLAALDRMNNRDEFREDVTQPFGLGTKCAKTYVTRCLVGEPGTSYKYLGLRMFAAPWQCNSDTETIQHLSTVMSKRAFQHMLELRQKRRARGAPPPKGMSPSFDICLINRMMVTSDLKPTAALPSDSDDNPVDQGKTSVSWHADSSLEHYSTIAVYQILESDNNKSKSKKSNSSSSSKDWWVGLRVTHHAEGPHASSGRKGSSIEAALVPETPPVAVSLPSGSAYYLLDDFNHHHQHIVFTTGKEATTGVRYSCTFRKLRESHNVQYWIERGNALKKSFNKKGVKVWKAEYLVAQELEFEWIRQFYVQGKRHHDSLWEPYWKAPMQDLLSLWSCLEHRAYQTLELLRAATEAKVGVDTDNSTHRPSKGERKERDRRKKALAVVESLLARSDTEDGSMANATEALSQLFIPMAECLEEEAKKRELWEKREKDHVFRELHPDCRPLPVPFRFHRPAGETIQQSTPWGSSPFPKSPSALREMAQQVRQLGEAFDESNSDKVPPSWKHAVSMDWGGWEEGAFGLELQEPWAAAVVDGSKAIETRLYPPPPSLVGKKIFILESKCGTAGMSNLGNFVDISSPRNTRELEPAVTDRVRVIGWCTFVSVKKYASREEFERDEPLHLVKPDSGYGWKDDANNAIYGWVVGEHGRYSDTDESEHFHFSSGVRRFRSLFELHGASRATEPPSATDTGEDSSRKGNKRNKNRYHDHGGRVTKRKRF
jgi:mRNA N6-methyladenine demethylase